MPPRAHARLTALGQVLAGPASAIAFVVAASAARLWLGQWLPGLTVFSLYYPAILASALIGGGSSATLALGLSVAISAVFLRNAQGLIVPVAAVALNLAIFVFTGALIGVMGATLRGLLRRRQADFAKLADREARYRTLFEGVSEGFVLCDVIRGDDGEAQDFVLREANPAFLKMFSLPPSIIGHRQSQHEGAHVPEFITASRRAMAGEPVRFEMLWRQNHRWFDIRLSRMGEDKLAQIFVDITDRKAAEGRNAEMYDELNHRVKNNLAAVSAMLSMQARVAEDSRVRDHLQKAVDRIQAIGDVHASLYRSRSADQVDFSGYLQRLCERLSTSLVDGERVRLEVTAESVMAPLEQAVALGLIVNELVTNAAKYAYPDGTSGVIQVQLSRSDGDLVLKVSDEGQGLPETSSGSASGIGMRLVRSLAQQCQARLEVKEGPGASFTIRAREHTQACESAQSRLL